MESSKALSVAGLLLIWLARTVKCQDSSSASQFNPNCPVLDEGTVEEDLNDVYLRCFTGETTSEPGKNSSVPFRQFTELLDAEKFDNSKCVVIVVGDRDKDNDNTKILNIIDSFLLSNHSNTCQLFWSSNTVDKPYEESAAFGTYLAPLLAEVLDQARDAGVSCIHMLGYSLGAHLVGATSRAMKKQCERLIGLDPAGTLLLNCLPPLNADDAECVRAIHTDAGAYGSANPNGVVDYWANGGTRPQPGCSEDNATEPYQGSETQESVCSHTRALDLVAEAIADKYTIEGVLCSSWAAFEAGECFNGPVAFMDACDDNIAPGSYFFRTSDSSPYGEGIDGILP